MSNEWWQTQDELRYIRVGVESRESNQVWKRNDVEVARVIYNFKFLWMK